MKKVILVFCVLTLATSVSFGDMMNDRPVPVYLGDTVLQGQLDTALNPDTLNAIDGQNSAAIWTPASTNQNQWTVNLAYNPYWLDGQFGVYSYGDTDYNVELIDTTSATSDLRSSFSISSTGTLIVAGGEGHTDFGQDFGFYYTGNGRTVYTEDSENGGQALALSYFIEDGTQVMIPGFDVFAEDNNDWLIAFEMNGNQTFAEGLFYVENQVSSAPVPETATLFLLGFGLLGFIGFREWKK